MKKFILTIAVFFATFGIISTADAYVSVKGYYRKNGTYVAPHVRSEPNGVKYDNYGYTPSQGLYNKTYGTRGTTWDTPTYVTDPDYYTGKNIYDSSHSDTNYSPSYTYTPTPAVTKTPTCPANATYDSLSSNCKCDFGYVVSGSSCVYGTNYCYGKYGYNSEYDSASKSCKCSYGSRWNDNSTNCVTNDSYCTSKYGYGTEAKAINGECVCKTGYTYDGSKCAPQPTCDTGYILKNNICITNTQDCKNSFGENVYGVALSENISNCYCNSGYLWNTEKTSCTLTPVANIINVTPTMVTDFPQEEQMQQITFTKNLKVGSRGEEVAKLQTILQSKKYLVRLASNGYFGGLTATALKKLQKDNGLTVTGYLDQPTRDMINGF